MTGRVPLLIAPDVYCQYSACEAVLLGRGAAGTYALAAPVLDGVDLDQPVALAELPFQLWTFPTPDQGEATRRDLTAEERRVAAGQIDYLIITRWPYSMAKPGPLEAALQANPALEGMGQDVAVRLALAPLVPGAGVLDLAALRFDLLDLTLSKRALAFPLAPRNDQDPGNGVVGLEAAAKAICPGAGLLSECQSLLER
jgi:hypothetical protein